MPPNYTMLPRDANGISAQQIRKLVGIAPTILEIGAHDGSDTVKFLAAMPRARIFCFEPDPRPLARFAARAFDSRVTLAAFAVADHDGACPWYASMGDIPVPHCYNRDWDYSSSLRRPTGHLTHSPEIGFREAGEVPCVRLDTWRQNASISAIDFAWVDVQGAQRDVIAGGRQTLEIIRYLYIELHQQPLYDGEPNGLSELAALLPNFDPIGRYADNVLFRNCTRD